MDGKCDHLAHVPVQHTAMQCVPAAHLALNVFATTCRMSCTPSMPLHSLPARVVTLQYKLQAQSGTLFVKGQPHAKVTGTARVLGLAVSLQSAQRMPSGSIW